MQLVANAILLLAASASASAAVATATTSNPRRDHHAEYHQEPHQLAHQHSYRHHPVRAANLTMSTTKQDHQHNHDAACGAPGGGGDVVVIQDEGENEDGPAVNPPVAGPEGGRLAPVPSGATGLLLPLGPLPTGGVRPTPFVAVAGAGRGPGAGRGWMGLEVGVVMGMAGVLLL